MVIFLVILSRGLEKMVQVSLTRDKSCRACMQTSSSSVEILSNRVGVRIIMRSRNILRMM